MSSIIQDLDFVTDLSEEQLIEVKGGDDDDRYDDDDDDDDDDDHKKPYLGHKNRPHVGIFPKVPKFKFPKFHKFSFKKTNSQSKYFYHKIW